MSDEFIQFDFPCSDCIIRAACKYKPTAKDDLYGRAGLPCLALPFVKEKSYHKMLIECWANLGFDLLNHVSKLEFPIGVNKDNQVPSSYIRAMQQMTKAIGYMVNSASWREGELFPFDKLEIDKKLKIGSI